MLPKTLIAAAALAAAAILPTAARASTVSLEGGTLVVRAAPGEANYFNVTPAWDTSRLRIADNDRLTSFPSSCLADDDEGLGALSCAMPPNGVRVEAGDRNDIVNVGDDEGASTSVTVDAGDGDDVVRADTWGVRMLGGAGNDKVTGSTGDDVADGGPGDDELQGLAGNDGVFGGDGNDTLAGDGFDVMGNDVIDGGAGYDQIEYDWLADVGDYQPPITVSEDGNAGDGRPGEADNVTAVEKIGLNAPVTLIGSDAAEDFSMFNTDGGGRLVGNGGDDKLTGFDLADEIDGGPGNDTIAGGYGDDTITGGPGRDAINADNSGAICGYTQCRNPYGNDTVDARDGEADSVDCGIGEDVAYVDAVDRVHVGDVVAHATVDRVGLAVARVDPCRCRTGCGIACSRRSRRCCRR